MELVGEGASCRVYEWGDGQVVKVYRRAFAYLAPIEAERAAAVHAAGVPSPAVHGIVDVDGRVGLVFECVRGPSLLDELLSRDRSVEDVGRVVAEVHVAIHAVAAPALPQLADALHERDVDGMPRGTAVFHGDFHPGNIFVRDGTTMVIDWSGAHAAPPAADVACAALAMGYRGLRVGHPDADRMHRTRQRLADAYLAAYRAERPAVFADFARWYEAIGELLLRQEPETAYADELRASWR